MAGAHANEAVYSYDEVPVIGPLNISLKAEKRPSKVTLQPENHPVGFTYTGGKLNTRVPKLELHSILVIEP